MSAGCSSFSISSTSAWQAGLSGPEIAKIARTKIRELLDARIGVRRTPVMAWAAPADSSSGAGSPRRWLRAWPVGANLPSRQPGSADRRPFSSFSVTQPQIFVDIDREKAKAQKVTLDDINKTLQASLGSFYVNDFTFQNRNWQVNVQADPTARLRVEDIGSLEVRNAAGDRVPMRTLVNIRNDSGPAVVNHYNLYPSAAIVGTPALASAPGRPSPFADRLGTEQLP